MTRVSGVLGQKLGYDRQFEFQNMHKSGGKINS